MNLSWDCLPLGEVFEIRAGKGTSASARNGEVQYPFLRTSNVLWDSIDLSSVAKMSLHGEELIEKKLVPGDLLVCGVGEVGRAAIWNGQCETMYYQDLYRLRPLRKDVVPRFYVFFLQSAFTQLNIYEGVANKTTIPNLPRNRLANLEIPVPPKKDQEKIVFALHTLRATIQVNDKLLKASNELKHATMHKLFTCGLRGEPQKQTEIGLVPVSWEPTAIDGIAIKTQYGLSMRGHSKGKYPILRMNCQVGGKVEFRDLQYVEVDDDTFLSFKLNYGDILFNRTNSIEHVGRTALYNHHNDAVFASYLVRLTVDTEKCLSEFINHYMNWPTMQRDIKKLASGVGQANINATKLRTVKIPLPQTLEEQQEIVDILNAIDQKIDLRRRKKAVLEELFKSLLYKLMTGEVRVDDLDLSTKEVS